MDKPCSYCICDCDKSCVFEIQEKAYQQGRADEQLQSIEDAKKQAAEYLDALDKAKKEAYQKGAKEFAEWLPQHFDLRFSNNPDVWIDEYFNHTRDKVLAEWQKGADNDQR